MKKYITAIKHLVIVSLLMMTAVSTAFAQNVSTEGTDFWLGFLPHNAPFGGDLQIFISTSQDTVNGTITVPGLGVVETFTLGSNSSFSFNYDIPSNIEDDVTADARNTVDTKTMHITTDNPISVYALNKAVRWSADATIVLPTITLGKQYYATCHYDNATDLPSGITIIGVEDNTDIEITPSVNLLGGGGQAGQPINITLNEGESYLIEAEDDLTGTKITTSNSTAGDCKNFAVFSGVNRARVGGCGSGADHLYQQSYPIKAWGKNFSFLSFQDRTSGDLVKIIAFEDNTSLNISGQNLPPLNAGDVREYTLQGVQTISANKPISVTQFSRSTACDGGGNFGDPFMITLSPNEQLLKKITFSAFPVFTNDFTYYVDIVSPTPGASTVTLEDGQGNPINLSFTPIGNGYSYSQVTLNVTGEHTINSDSGFVANVYGFGDGDNEFESFGYTTGASLNNLNFTIVSVDSGQLVPDDTEVLCLGNSISFAPDVDTAFKFFEWDMGDGTIIMGKDITHTYTAPGIYNVEVKASTALGDCATEQTAVKTVEIRKSDFGIKGPLSVCPNTADILYTSFDPKGDYAYTWTVEGGTILSGQGSDSLRVDWGNTNANASILAIAVDDIGCDDTTRVDVIVNDVLEPSAPIGADSICYADLTQKYEALFASGNAYEFFVEGGTLTEDTSNPNGNTVFVTWDTTATVQMLWYKESNLANIICEGISDTLFVSTILPEIKTASLAVTDISCFGESDGAIAFTAEGGVGELRYVFHTETDTFSTGITRTNLVADTYNVHVIDETGCKISPEIIVAQPDPLAIDTTVTHVVCHGDATGKIQLTVTGGTAPYRYIWSGGVAGDTSLAENLPAGDYQVKIEDSNDCELFSSFIKVTQPDEMTFDISGPHSVCQFTDNKVYVITDDDADSYTWFVEGGTITAGQNTDTLVVAWGAEGAGRVRAISENALGCISDTLDFDVTVYAYEQPSVADGADTLCYVDTLGITYEITPKNGVGYNWFTAGSSNTVISADGNSITVDWESSGTHKVWYEEYVISEPVCAAFSDTLEVVVLTELQGTISMTQVSCFGGANGTVTMTPSGSLAGYTYTWSHDATLKDSIATGLTAGMYNVQVTDAFGCQKVFTIEVTEPTALMVDSVSVTDATCFGGADGIVEVNISGGIAPYAVVWDDPAAQTTAKATNLSAGTYNVVVTDDSLCTNSLSLTVKQPVETIFSLSGPDSVCQRTTHTYQINDDIRGQTFTWEVEGNGIIVSGQGSKAIRVFWETSPGRYAVKAFATNNLGCNSATYTFDVLVYEFPQPAAPVGQDSICYSDPSTLTYRTPHTVGHGYQWFIEGGTLEVVAGSAGNEVQVNWSAVNDARRLWFEEYVLAEPVCRAASEVLEMNVLSESFGILEMKPVSCFQNSDGEITVVKSGGIGNYSYSWDHDVSLNTATAPNLTAATYSVLLTDEFGCESRLAIDVTEPAKPVDINLVSLTDVDCHGNATGAIEIMPTGGTGAYTITWNDEQQQTTAIANNLVEGTYTVVVEDANLCPKTATYTITQPDPFTYTVIDTLPSRCKVPEGSGELVVSGGTPPYSYNWLTTKNFNQGKGKELPAGINPIEITDKLGCEYNAEMYIYSKTPEIYFPTAFSPNGDGVNDEFQLFYTCDGNVSFTVYDRWGDTVFKTDNPNINWDGTVGGNPTPIGLYTYRLIYTLEKDGKFHKIEKSGTLLLVR